MVSLRQLVATVLVSGLIIGAASCRGSDADDPDEPGRPDGVPTFAERLALLPHSLVDEATGKVTVTMADLDRAAALAGATAPTDPTDQTAAGGYLNALQGVAGADGPTPEVSALLPDQATPVPPQVAEFDAEVGWSVLDVTWYVEHPTPPNQLTVLGGGFDPGRITGAVGEPVDGIWRAGEGEDRQQRLDEVTAARPLGMPLLMSGSSGRMIVSVDTELVDAARAGADRTFADVAGLRDLATVMEAEEAYSAMFVSGDLQVDLGRPDLDPADLPDGVSVGLSREFDAVAGGLAHDGGGPVVLLAYAHADPADAEANADQLRTELAEARSAIGGFDWSERFEVEEVRVDGTTVLARLVPREGHPRIAYDLLFNRDPLVSYR